MLAMAMAFSRAEPVMMSWGLMSFLRKVRMVAPASRHSCCPSVLEEGHSHGFDGSGHSPAGTGVGAGVLLRYLLRKAESMMMRTGIRVRPLEELPTRALGLYL